MNFYKCFVLPFKKGFAFKQIIFKRLTLGSVFKYTRFKKNQTARERNYQGPGLWMPVRSGEAGDVTAQKV